MVRCTHFVRRHDTWCGVVAIVHWSAPPPAEIYTATKGGMISMVRGLAVGFASYKVRAHAILPEWIETDMTERPTMNHKFRRNFMPRIPMRRWGAGDDFGGLAVYLMSAASQYHTGDTFVANGAYALL